MLFDDYCYRKIYTGMLEYNFLDQLNFIEQYSLIEEVIVYNELSSFGCKSVGAKHRVEVTNLTLTRLYSTL